MLEHCNKCKVERICYFVHIDKDDAITLCIECMGNPEYLVDCPHCDASVAVN